MQIDSSLGTTLPLTELGLLIEVACNRSSLHIVVAKWVRMPGATTRRCLPILEEEQRRRRADFAAILRTDGRLRAISALRLVDDAQCIAFLTAP